MLGQKHLTGFQALDSSYNGINGVKAASNLYDSVSSLEFGLKGAWPALELSAKSVEKAGKSLERKSRQVFLPASCGGPPGLGRDDDKKEQGLALLPVSLGKSEEAPTDLSQEAVRGDLHQTVFQHSWWVLVHQCPLGRVRYQELLPI